jgi:hypothetical protein
MNLFRFHRGVRLRRICCFVDMVFAPESSDCGLRFGKAKAKAGELSRHGGSDFLGRNIELAALRRNGGNQIYRRFRKTFHGRTEDIYALRRIAVLQQWFV